MAYWIASPSPATSLVQGLQVHLIESDESQLAPHRDALEQAGAVVLASCSGAEALRAASTRDFDVVVCATDLQDVDGFRLIRMLRRLRPDLQPVGSIALAARGDEEDIAAALRAGFDLHAVAPLAASDLVHMVAALGKRPEPAATGALREAG